MSQTHETALTEIRHSRSSRIIQEHVHELQIQVQYRGLASMQPSDACCTLRHKQMCAWDKRSGEALVVMCGYVAQTVVIVWWCDST